MLKTGAIAIIADDLTGANDTALQFFVNGANTQILLDWKSSPEAKANTMAWAVSTESRNVEAGEAEKKVARALEMLSSELSAEYFYKKIDSTLRGNIAPECMKAIEVLDYDAAIIAPAFPAQGRTTVGGYQLLNGVPIERTEAARDPQAPIYKSYIPLILGTQFNDIVGLVDLNTAMQGAALISMKINELIKEGKKLIVVDAVSNVDLEQISLAIEKNNNKLLPCGSAGLAGVLTKSWLPDLKNQDISKTIPKLPIVTVAGSKTALSKLQLEKLKQTEELTPIFIKLSAEDIFEGKLQEAGDRILETIVNGDDIVIYPEEMSSELTEKYTAEKIPHIITDFMAELVQKISVEADTIFVFAGGETSYKCCSAIGARHLHIVDEIENAIPLCLDHNARWIVTKSGNFGSEDTLINILNYFKKY